MVHNFRDLDVWKRSMSLAERVYAVTRKYPEEEKFGLITQTQRAVVSIASNIAAHFNPFGAWQIAKMIVMGLKQLNSPLVQHLRSDWQDYNPAQPDDPEAFVWHMSAGSNLTKPDGN